LSQGGHVPRWRAFPGALISLLSARQLEHFQESWDVVFRPKMRPMQKCQSGFSFQKPLQVG
jgi:hypothetical protein